MRGPLGPSSVSGLVTTMDVRGVTKLYFRDISRALAVALLFFSAGPLLLVNGNNTNNSDSLAPRFRMYTQSNVVLEIHSNHNWLPSAQTWSPVVVGW